MKEKPMELPEAVSRYWAAANAGRIAEAVENFSPDAVVHDEGETHRGQAAIRKWIAGTTEKYHPQVKALRAEEKGGQLVATAQVSGDFPGSPAELEFAFRLEGGKIAGLEVL